MSSSNNCELVNACPRKDLSVLILIANIAMSDIMIGFIGLGDMGGPVAQNLLNNEFDLTVYDTDDNKITKFGEYGADIATSIPEAVTHCDIIITSLPTPEVVEDVYLGVNGIASNAKEGTVGIEISTIDPDTTQRIQQSVSSDGINLVDAPVSGDPEHGINGTLTLLVGGAKEVVDRDSVQTVLHTIGNKVHHVGTTGAGHTIKLLNNVMSMGNLLLAMEMISLGVERGIKPEVLYEVLGSSGAKSYMFNNRMPRVLNRNFETGFAVDYAKKDINLAVEMGRSDNFPMVQTAVISQLYTKASQAGHGNKDIGSIIKIFERQIIESDNEIDESFDGL